MKVHLFRFAFLFVFSTLYFSSLAQVQILDDRIGIGVITPDSALHVGGGAEINGGLHLNSGTGNVFIGEGTGSSNTIGQYNTASGRFSFSSNTTGNNNVAYGNGALNKNLDGSSNTAFGFAALQYNQSGSSNTVNGYFALRNNLSGSFNVGVGRQSLYLNKEGDFNIAIGYQAGYSALGNSNVFLGRSAGYHETGSNKLYIENSNTENPLIYGEFDTNILRVNGQLQIGNAFSLPTADGTDGQVLTTDGNGITSWTTPVGEGGNSIWTENGSDVYRESGRVGIGNTAPQQMLDINGAIRIKSTSTNLTGSIRYLNGDFEGYTSSGWKSLTTQPDDLPLGTWVSAVTYSAPGTWLSPCQRSCEIASYNPGSNSNGNTCRSTSGNEGIHAYLQSGSNYYCDGNVLAQCYCLINSGNQITVDNSIEQKQTINELKLQNKNLQNELLELKGLVTQLLENENTYTANSTISLSSARLEQNQPNPFSENTIVKYYLPNQAGQGRLKISDSSGRVIREIILETRGEGFVNIEAHSLSPGTYAYTLIIDGETIDTKQMLLTR